MRDPNEYTDIYTQAKSDQLNADDIIGRKLIVQIQRVRGNEAERRITATISGGHMPWVLSKGMVRALTRAWGARFADWPGKWVEIYNEPSVMYAGKERGGVRVCGASHMDGPLTIKITEGRNRFVDYHIRLLSPEECRDAGAPTADLHAFLDENNITMGQLDTFFAAKDKPLPSEMNEAKQSAVAVRLAASPDVVAEVRAIGGE